MNDFREYTAMIVERGETGSPWKVSYIASSEDELIKNIQGDFPGVTVLVVEPGGGMSFDEFKLAFERFIRCHPELASDDNAGVGAFGDQLILKTKEGKGGAISIDDASTDEVMEWLGDLYPGVERDVAAFRIFVRDETEYWMDEDLLRRAGGKIFSTYLYDSAARVHLCEITPSYFMRHLFSTPLKDDDFGSVSEDIRDSERLNDNDFYMHCHHVDSGAGNVRDFGFDLFPKGDEAALREIEDAYMELCRGDCGGIEVLPDESEPSVAAPGV